MVQNAARKIDLAGEAKDAVRKILDQVRADIRLKSRSRCSAQNTNGRAARAFCNNLRCRPGVSGAASAP